MKRDTTICIPTIAPRSSVLLDALNSVSAQTHPVEAVCIAQDVHHEGAWHTRNRAARMSQTTWTAFLDDDDQLLPHHVGHLLDCAEEHGADLVSSWMNVIGGSCPWPENQGRQWDPDNWHVIAITYMVRTELLHAAMDKCGGFLEDTKLWGAWDLQDLPVFRAMYDLSGGRFYASSEVSWNWHHHSYAGGNTSGLPTRWK